MRNHSRAVKRLAAQVNGMSRNRRALARRLVALPLAIMLIAPSASALAAETTTGYNQTPPPPKTTPAKQEAAPTRTSSTPAQEASPTATTGEPTTATAPSAKTLPFTGLDLRWVIVGGVLLLGAGLSIVFVQRTRHGTGR
jgi:hypothetical protein